MRFFRRIIALFRKPEARPLKRRPPLKENQVSIPIPFVFTHETHDTASFQEAQGRFLPALRVSPSDAPANPNELATPPDRPWGPEVHVLRLPHPHDPQTNILRKLSDSLEDCEQMVAEELPRSLYGLWTAQFVRQGEAHNIERLSREWNHLRDFVVNKHSKEVFDLVIAGGMK